MWHLFPYTNDQVSLALHVETPYKDQTNQENILLNFLYILGFLLP